MHIFLEALLQRTLAQLSGCHAPIALGHSVMFRDPGYRRLNVAYIKSNAPTQPLRPFFRAKKAAGVEDSGWT